MGPLHRGEISGKFHLVREVFNDDSYLVEFIRQPFNDSACIFGSNISWTLLVKHESQRVLPFRPQLRDIAATLNSALGYRKHISRHSLRQPECCCQIHLERTQVAAVDADQIAPGIERTSKLIFVMNLAKHI